MAFQKKTSAQIKAMSDAEFDTYTAEKEAHDQETSKAAIKSALDAEMKTLPEKVKEATKELETEVETLKGNNTTLANKLTALEAEKGKKEKENPYAAIKQEDIDKFNGELNSDKASMNFTIKTAGTMLVGTNMSGNTNFNLILEEGQPAAVPIPPPLMVQIADVRMIKNPGKGGIPTVGWINKTNLDGTAGITAEGALKPLLDFDLVGQTMECKEIAARENVGKYMLRDYSQMQEVINIDLRTQMDKAADLQYLSGAGTTEMNGLLDYASAYTDTSLDGDIPDAGVLDAILAAALQIELVGWTGTLTAVVNPVTYTQIYGYKSLKHRETGLVIVSERGGELYVNNIRIKKSLKITAGYLLVGDFSKSHIRIVDDVEIMIGYGASTDDFNKNLLTVRGDMRACHFVKSVETSAFVYDTIQNIIDAIQEA